MRGVQIIRFGLLVFALALLFSHLAFVPDAAASFLIGGGAALTLVGAGKRVTELRAN